ncbi:MAG: hypothetical protein SVT56_12775 [Chloroflexota bacterium]|nr:hypothetical protein [Chloroflexota bacterium]
MQITADTANIEFELLNKSIAVRRGAFMAAAPGSMKIYQKAQSGPPTVAP